MTVFQERLPNDYASLVRRIEALERDLQSARAARRLEAATIGRGGITIQGGAIILKDAAGNEIARMGIREDLLPEPGGNPQPGFILRRNDGSIAFTLDDPNPSDHGYRQLLKMQDSSGFLIFEEDYVTGWGLAAPTFAYALYPYGDDTARWPKMTGTTFWRLMQTSMTVWNPILQVGVTAVASASTTGTLQLLINGSQQGSLQTVTPTQDNFFWTVDLSQIVGVGPGALVSVEIYAKSSSASGVVVGTPVYLYGEGAPGTH